ncbi:MAG: LytTR family DNA-binding domain-containing protein [Bacteroidota bacterium]
MQNPLKTVLIDDDALQLEIISAFVRKTGFLQLEKSFQDPVEGMDFIIENTPDLLLLDVEMPTLTGFDLIRSLDHVPKTIIITGEKKYAAKAFDFDVLDYLVKPVDDYSRFLRAVNKARPATQQDKVPNKSIYVRENSLLVKVMLDDIMYFEANGRSVKIGTSNETYVINSPLEAIEKKLDDNFLKVHQSFIVRLDQIKNIDQSNLQAGDKIIPISPNMREGLMAKIDTF